MTTTTKGTTRALRMVAVVRDLDPEMRIQTLDTLLRVAAAGRSGLHMTELQRGLKLTLAATSRNVALLSKVNAKGAKAWGLVQAVEDPMDRRHRIIYLTSKGQEFINKIEEAIG